MHATAQIHEQQVLSCKGKERIDVGVWVLPLITEREGAIASHVEELNAFCRPKKAIEIIVGKLLSFFYRSDLLSHLSLESKISCEPPNISK